MKINDVQRTNAINPYRNTNEPKLSPADEKKQKRRDEVNISSEAKELQVSKGSNQVVDDLKQSYMTGNYHVEARQIAEKLFPYI
ncbi:MAG: flagellar synthesis anti-sigma-D factor [Bacilli bacterium]|jgi:negative regulator of flagellin synthesis FlgM|nr:flagellar synthesis anti-sigma-D factor [Bacilli bacterium]